MKIISKFKSSWIYILTLSAVMAITFCITIGYLNDLSSVLSPISTWAANNKYMFIAWHALILAAFVIAWDYLINIKAKKYKVSADKLKAVTNAKWALVLIVVIIDLLSFWGM